MTRITIRPLRLTDTDDIYELMHMPNVLWGMPLLPSTTHEAWRQCVEQWIGDEQVHMFVTDIQSKVIGLVHVQTGRGRAKHVADIFMVVHDKYQGQGMGKMLMLTAIDLADNWLNLTRLQVNVYADNERALHLLKNFDFEIEGRLRSNSYRSGKYVDSYTLGRLRPQGQGGHTDTVTQVPVVLTPIAIATAVVDESSVEPKA